MGDFIVVQIPQSGPMQTCMGEPIPLSCTVTLWDHCHMFMVDQNIMEYVSIIEYSRCPSETEAPITAEKGNEN